MVLAVLKEKDEAFQITNQIEAPFLRTDNVLVFGTLENIQKPALSTIDDLDAGCVRNFLKRQVDVPHRSDGTHQ